MNKTTLYLEGLAGDQAKFAHEDEFVILTLSRGRWEHMGRPVTLEVDLGFKL